MLKLLAEFSVDVNSCKVLLDDSEVSSDLLNHMIMNCCLSLLQEVSVLSLVLKHMRHLQTAIQYLCVTTLLHLAMNSDDSRCGI